MAAEVEDQNVARWSRRLIMLGEWLWIRAALVSVAFLVLVVVYGWAWKYVVWPLAGALVARLVTNGFRRVRDEAEKRVNLWN